MFWKSWARGRLSNSIFQVEPQINQKLDFPLCVGHNCQYGRHAITLNIAGTLQFSIFVNLVKIIFQIHFTGSYRDIQWCNKTCVCWHFWPHFFYGTIGLLATYWTAEDTGAASKNIFFVTFPKLLWSPSFGKGGPVNHEHLSPQCDLSRYPLPSPHYDHVDVVDQDDATVAVGHPVHCLPPLPLPWRHPLLCYRYHPPDPPHHHLIIEIVPACVALWPPEHPEERALLKKLEIERKDFLAKHAHAGVKGEWFCQYYHQCNDETILIISTQRGKRVVS